MSTESPDTAGIDVISARLARDVEALRAIAGDQAIATVHRAVAIYKLGDLGDHESVGLMTSLASSTDGDLRNAAVAGLARIGDVGSLPLLLAVARDERDDFIRWHAYEGLGRIRHPDAVPVLISGLREDRWWGRRMAATQLARVGGPAASHALRAAARRELRPLRTLRLRRLARRSNRMVPLDAGEASG